MSVPRVLLALSTVFITVLFVVFMILYPQQSLQAALVGVGIWWDVLFPALFPFFIIAELLLSFGIVHFFGTLLDPLMRPMFRVPGIGGFVMAMGFASGYPVGARLTSQLWDQKMINRVEGERLVAFTSTSDPIFLIGAVAVGFFHTPEIALILCVAHYGASIIVGFLMRFHAGGAPLTAPSGLQEGSLLVNALRNMHHARLAAQRPFGTMLREAAVTALRLIFVIGGLVVFFSVLIEVLTRTNILPLLSNLVSSMLALTGLPAQLSDAFINGLFEVTLGNKSAGGAEAVPLIYKAAAAAFVLSWAGLSVHAQIVSLMSHTGMRYIPFMIARFAHGLIAMWLVFLLWDVASPLASWSQAWIERMMTASAMSGEYANGWQPHILILTAIAMLSGLCLLSLLIHWVKRVCTAIGRDRAKPRAD